MNFSSEHNEMALINQGIVTGVVKIVDLEGRFALVEPESKSGCKSCAMAKGCGTKMISGYFARNLKPIKIPNKFAGQIGDRIEVGMENATILKLSAITYMFPILGMLLVVLCLAPLQLSNLVTLLVSVFGLWLGFIGAQWAFSTGYITRSVELVFLSKLAKTAAPDTELKKINGCPE